MRCVGTSDDNDDNDDDHHDHDHNDDHHDDDHGHDGNGGDDDSVSWMGVGHASDTGGWTNF